MNHRRLPFYCSLSISMLRTANFLHPPFTDFGVRFVDQVMSFLYCNMLNPSVDILAVFKARHMFDCYSCTRSSCLAIVSNILKTNLILVVASNNNIQLLPQPSMLLKPSQWSSMPNWFTVRYPYHGIYSLEYRS
jgi:hypothetical protein